MSKCIGYEYVGSLQDRYARSTGQGLWDIIDGQAGRLPDSESESVSGRPCDLTGRASSTDP